MATPVSHFVWLEVGNLIETISWLGSIASVVYWAVIAMVRMEMIIYTTVEVGGSMKPRASANEYATNEPFGAIDSRREHSCKAGRRSSHRDNQAQPRC